VASDAVRWWERGRTEHTAETVGVLEAQCPLDSNNLVRAGVGAGSAVLEETPVGAGTVLPWGAPLPSDQLSSAWHHPSWAATRGLPENTSTSVVMFDTALSMEQASEAR